MENRGEEASSSWDARCKSPEMQLCVTCSRKSQEAGVAGAGGWEGSVVSGGERGERAGGPSAVTQPLALILSVRGSHRRTEDSAVWQDGGGAGRELVAGRCVRVRARARVDRGSCCFPKVWI